MKLYLYSPHIPSWCTRDSLNLPLPVTNPKTKVKRNKLHTETYIAVYIHNSCKVKKNYHIKPHKDGRYVTACLINCHHVKSGSTQERPCVERPHDAGGGFCVSSRMDNKNTGTVVPCHILASYVEADCLANCKLCHIWCMERIQAQPTSNHFVESLSFGNFHHFYP